MFAVNVIGAIIYDVAASPSWAIPQERALGIYSVTGEPFVWFGAILPIVIAFLALNYSVS
jgi:hypothetical protein